MATILLIDDDRAVRELLEMVLSAEHECHTADRAEQALELVEFENYDLVITDVSMPGLGGLEVLQRIKLRHAIPVIVISGRISDYQEAAMRMGAFAFLGKPFPLAELERVVLQAIETRAPMPTARALS